MREKSHFFMKRNSIKIDKKNGKTYTYRIRMIPMLKKYKLTLIVIATLVGCAITAGIGYLYFDSPLYGKKEAFVYIDGDLSFNYINGNIIDTTEQETTYEFSITNTAIIPYYYNLIIEDAKGDNATFEVKSNRKGFQTIKRNYPSDTLRYGATIKIDGGETHSYTFTIRQEQNNQITGKLVVELEKEMNTFANMILKNNIANMAPATKASLEIATENEGLIETTDDTGTCYYFRGAVTNNYVSFANYTWRIVKINGDGTVKLILDDVINNNTQFYSEAYDLTFQTSNLYQILQEWYQTNLKEYDSTIANAKYCTDANIENSDYATKTRLYTDHDPIFHCLGQTETLKIGLLTADELALAGATNTEDNKEFYLKNDNIQSSWWSMSPASIDQEEYRFIEISQNGRLNNGTLGNLFRGARPVINIVKRVTVTGTGTMNDPYVVNTL